MVIRPLAYCKEADIEAYAAARRFPIIPCKLCGSQENLQRQTIKTMLRAWEKQAPGRLDTIFASLRNVTPSHLADTRLFDFINLGLPAGSRATSWNWLMGAKDAKPPSHLIPIHRQQASGDASLPDEPFDLSSGAW